MCAIFLKHGKELVEMVEQGYEAESVLQQLLADYPVAAEVAHGAPAADVAG